MRFRSGNPAGTVSKNSGRPQIRVKSGTSSANGKIYVRLAGFTPRAPVTLNIQALAPGPPPEEIWEARAVFRTNDEGMVDVGLQEPLSADPAFAADALGLFGTKHSCNRGRSGPAAGYTIAFSALTGGKLAATAVFKPPPPKI